MEKTQTVKTVGRVHYSDLREGARYARGEWVIALNDGQVVRRVPDGETRTLDATTFRSDRTPAEIEAQALAAARLVFPGCELRENGEWGWDIVR